MKAQLNMSKIFKKAHRRAKSQKKKDPSSHYSVLFSFYLSALLQEEKSKEFNSFTEKCSAKGVALMNEYRLKELDLVLNFCEAVSCDFDGLVSLCNERRFLTIAEYEHYSRLIEEFCADKRDISPYVAVSSLRSSATMYVPR